MAKDPIKEFFKSVENFFSTKSFRTETTTNKKREKRLSKDTGEGFFIFVRTDDFGKSNLFFKTQQQAKRVYDKSVLSKKITYKDIVDFDELENKLYKQWKSEGNIGKEGYPKGLTQKSKIQEIVYGQGDTEIKRKTFR